MRAREGSYRCCAKNGECGKPVGEERGEQDLTKWLTQNTTAWCVLAAALGSSVSITGGFMDEGALSYTYLRTNRSGP